MSPTDPESPATSSSSASSSAMSPVDAPEARALPGAARDELATLVFGWLAGASGEPSASLAAALEGQRDPIYVALRRHGRRVLELWVEVTAGESLPALRSALSSATPEQGVSRAEIDSVELCLSHDWRELSLADPSTRQALAANIHRGVRGMAFTLDGQTTRIAPTRVIAQNRNHGKWIENYRQTHRLTERDLQTRVRTHSFEAQQLLLEGSEGDTGPRGHALFRGNRLVHQAEIDRAAVQALERTLGDFLFRAVHPDGRMTYMYYPSQGSEDTRRNNMIRQWMASVALCRTARWRGEDRQLFARAEDNIRYNLRKFYHASGKLGCIEWMGKVKLGAVALAVLAILEHPRRAQFKRIEPKLWNMIDHLWQPDGGFVTFFKPAGRNDVQNFYPGEALLAWAFRYEEQPEPALLERFMSSMRYYREWHRAQRNPAFVPWHVQAYYKVWRITGDDELKDWIFDMSDWLLGMAQWRHNTVYEDTLGRFHDPANPGYGPPHASATGVYLEGLIDAFELARAVGDEDRRERYRLAILRGLRSVQQVMFKDARDMYYVARDRRAWLHGGVRNTVYDNIVRIDNVQHNQMGIIKILSAFEEGDYAGAE